MKQERSWGWPIACYLFLGGLGGGMLIISSLADLVFRKGDVFSLCALISSICLGAGSGLLIFELGRPFQFWRVLSFQKAIMTVGAWILTVTSFTGIIWFSFWPDLSPWVNLSSWQALVGLRHSFAVANLVLGIGVCIYTGILLGSLRTRAFWNTPIVPVLFLVSGLSTGAATQALLAGAWPYAGDRAVVEAAHAALRSFDLALIALELMVLFLYVIMMRLAAGKVAAQIAAKWLAGPKSLAFWGGLVVLGLVIPGLLYLAPSTAAHLAAQVLILIGGLILRFLVVYSDERAELPGEAEYYARLPESDVPFMKAWE